MAHLFSGKQQNNRKHFTMRYSFITLFFLFFCAVGMKAQTMTDDQVVEYITAEHAKGTGQQQIAMDLLSKGATKEQLLRIKSKYESGSGATAPTTLKVGDRTRENNGELIPDEETMAAYEEPSKIFGHDIFRSKNLSFEPNMNIATPAKYTLGPGDEVIIDVYGDSQISNTYKVSPDGAIVIDKIGPVSVSGLTVAQAQSRVSGRMGEHYQGSSIKVSIGQTRTLLVNVMGEVTTPGTYTLSAFSTVFNALYMAGGITDIGTMRNIKVSRNGKVIATVDVYDYIVNGRLTGNILLNDNDVIIVGPYENLVEVTGKIKRPMFYEMKSNESLQSLLKYAGGFTGDAYRQKVRVERKSSDGLTVHNVDEWDFTNFHNTDGDIVVISPIIERYKNTVEVQGAVFRPGFYKLGDGQNTVKTLVEQSGGLMEQAVSNRVVLHRMKADRTLEALSVDLDAILSGNAPDVPLQNEDKLIIASSEKLYTDRYLIIEGEVQNPGKYEYSENETIEDLIIEAGGLRETASTDNIEVARRIISAEDNPDGKQMAKVFNFNLKENLGISDGSGFTLKPYDFVTIHRNPDYMQQKRITVTGEVKYAGSYILQSKEERISDVIKRAGGLTAKAHAGGAQLSRMFTEKEMEMKYQLLEMATTASDSIAAQHQLDKTSYNIGFDLEKALQNPGSYYDVVLSEGDSIYIPQFNNVVKISGEVLYPNTVSYAAKKSGSYYLNQAGGVSKKGQKSQAYIVYANGQVSTLKKGKIEPGCEIVVPTKVDKKVDTAKVSMWATLSSSVATVGAVISSILR